jgi:hypothetical protein
MLKNKLRATIALFFAFTAIFNPQAKADTSIFKNSEKVVYFLDVSSSSDSERLWTFLKTSLLERLETALGAPSRPGIKKAIKPTDLSISVINDNSQSAQVIEILSVRDAERIWGFMINKVGGGKPTSLRMEEIYKDFFGNPGVYSALVREFADEGQAQSISTSSCQRRAEAEFKRGNFMDNVTPSIRMEASKEVCSVITKLIRGINLADEVFESDQCGQKACSDVIGAVQRAQAVAVDLTKGRVINGTKPKLCLAIASDMLNNYPGISKTSPWNTIQAIKNSRSTEDAENLGRTVAEEASIKFTSKVKVRVEVIGQGASKNFPRELRSKLDAYWNGFWNSAGVQGSAQQASLDQACK